MRNETREFNLNDSAKVAVKVFRDAKPWKGTAKQRWEKFETLHRGLCRAYDMETILERDESLAANASSLSSRFVPGVNKIVLSGRLSAVTYLFCFVAARGATSSESAMESARKIFKHFFPRSYGGCRDLGGAIVRDQTMRN